MLWIIFVVLICVLLFIDLNVDYTSDKGLSTRKALGVTSIWIAISLLFSIFIYYAYEFHWFGIGLHVGHDTGGTEAAINYLTGYLIEESLSIDNIFIIALIFGYFKIPPKYQRRLLFIGIMTAMVLRGVVIIGGSYLINKYAWITYIFGAFLIFTALRMLKSDDGEKDLKDSALYKFAVKLFPVTDKLHGKRFFVFENGKRFATPMFIALIIIELADVMFAFDSIPAIFAITTDPFLVFTSNIFAILGLRSLYFVLASMLDRFAYLKYSLIVILAFVGVKLLTASIFHIPSLISLVIIIVLIALGIIISIHKSKQEAGREPEEPEGL